MTVQESQRYNITNKIDTCTDYGTQKFGKLRSSKFDPLLHTFYTDHWTIFSELDELIDD